MKENAMTTLYTVTCEDVLSQIGTNKVQYISLIIISLEYFCYSAELLLPVVVQTDLLEEYKLTKNIYGLGFVFPAIVSVISTLFWGRMVDLFGRRIPLFISMLGSTVFSGAIAFTNRWAVWVVLRCCVGYFGGAIVVIAYIIGVEIFPVHNRARFVTVISIFGSGGVLFVAVTASVVGSIDVGWSHWRITAVTVSSVMLVVTFCHWSFVFETPRYYVVNNEEEKAWDVFQHIVADKGNLDDFLKHPRDQCRLCVVLDEPEADVHSIFDDPIALQKKKTIKPNQRTYVQEIESLFEPQFRLHTILCMLLSFTHVAGYWGVTYFLPFFYVRLGQNDSLLITLNTLGRFPGLFLCSYLLDGPHKFQGRIATMRWLGGITFFLLVTCYALLHSGIRGITACIPLILIHLPCLPIFATLSIYYSETYPTALRSTASSLMTGIQYFCTTFIPFASAAVADLMDVFGFWFYPLTWAVVYALFVITTLFLTLEKKNKPLEDKSKSQVQWEKRKTANLEKIRDSESLNLSLKDLSLIDSASLNVSLNN